MNEGLEDRKAFRVKVQRTPAGGVLGCCLMIGDGDLSFVDSNTEWLTVKKKKTDNGLIIELGA